MSAGALKVGEVYAEAGVRLQESGFRRFRQSLRSARTEARKGARAELGADYDRRPLNQFGIDLGQAREKAQRPVEAKVRFDYDDEGHKRFQRDLKASRHGLADFATRIPLAKIGAYTTLIGGAAAGTAVLAGNLKPLAGLGAAGATGLVGLASAGLTTKLAMLGSKDAVKQMGEELQRQTPEAQRFFGFLKNEGIGVLQDLRQRAQRGLFPGLQRGLEAGMSKSTVRGAQALVDNTSRALGRVGERAGREVGKPEWGRDMTQVSRSNARALEDVGDAGISLMSVLRNLVVEAGPLTEWLAASTKRWADQTEAQSNMNRQTGKTRDFFERTRRTLQRVVSIGDNVADTFGNITDAGDRASSRGGFLRWLDRATDKMERWTASAEGQGKMEAGFESIEEALQGIAERFEELTEKEGKSTGAALIIMVAEGVTEAIPQVVEHLAEKAPEMAKALLDGFMGSNVWGKVAIGAFIASRLFGGGMLRKAASGAGFTMANAVLPAITGRLGRGGSRVRDALARLFRGRAATGAAAGAGGEAAGAAAGGITGRLRRLGPRVAQAFRRMFPRRVAASAGASAGAEAAGSAAGAATGRLGRARQRVAQAFRRMFPRRVAAAAAEGAGAAAAGSAVGGSVGRMGRLRQRVAQAFRRMFPRRVATAAAAEAGAAAAGSAAGAVGGQITKTSKKGGRLHGMFRGAGKLLGPALVAGILLAIPGLVPAVRDALGIKPGKGKFGQYSGKAGWGELGRDIGDWLPGKDSEQIRRRGTKTGRAAGGPVMRGMRYLVGEEGPEEFEPTQGGRIVPARRTAARLALDRQARSRATATVRPTAVQAGAGKAQGAGAQGGLAEELERQRKRAGQPLRRIATDLGALERQARKSGEKTGKGITKPLEEAEKDGFKSARRMRRRVGGEIEDLRKDTERDMRRLSKRGVDRLGDLRVDGDRQVRRLQRSLDGRFGEIRRNGEREFRRMGDRTTRSASGMARTVGRQGSRMAASMRGSMGSTSSAVYTGMTYIGRAASKALDAFGGKAIQLNVPKPKGLQTGGQLRQFGRRGERGPDSINLNFGGQDVMVAPGEVGMVATGRQQAILQRRLADYGGLEGFFATENQAHSTTSKPTAGMRYQRGGLAGPRRYAPGGIVPIPGMPGESIHKSILGEVNALVRKYKLMVTDGFATSGHAANSDHYKGMAVDLVPGGGGSWDLVDKLAAYAEPSQNNPRPPFRWVGYNGDANHGRGHHLHLSWSAGKHLKGLGGGDVDVPKIKVVGPDGALKVISQEAIDKVRGQANKKISSESSAGDPDGHLGQGKPGAGTATRAQMVSWARQALMAEGKPPTAANINKILTLARKESGWKVDSINNWDSNAKAGNPSGGLMHVTIDKVGGSREALFDPVINMRASIRYQYGRYGGLITRSPYAQGGLVQTARRLAQGGMVHAERFNQTGHGIAAVQAAPGGAFFRDDWLGGPAAEGAGRPFGRIRAATGSLFSPTADPFGAAGSWPGGKAPARDPYAPIGGLERQAPLTYQGRRISLPKITSQRTVGKGKRRRTTGGLKGFQKRVKAALGKHAGQLAPIEAEITELDETYTQRERAFDLTEEVIVRQPGERFYGEGPGAKEGDAPARIRAGQPYLDGPAMRQRLREMDGLLQIRAAIVRKWDRYVRIIHAIRATLAKANQRLRARRKSVGSTLRRIRKRRGKPAGQLRKRLTTEMKAIDKQIKSNRTEADSYKGRLSTASRSREEAYLNFEELRRERNDLVPASRYELSQAGADGSGSDTSSPEAIAQAAYEQLQSFQTGRADLFRSYGSNAMTLESIGRSLADRSIQAAGVRFLGAFESQAGLGGGALPSAYPVGPGRDDGILGGGYQRGGAPTINQTINFGGGVSDEQSFPQRAAHEFKAALS